MKKEELYEALGQIDEAYISDAGRPPKKTATTRHSRSAFMKWGSLAACFCLIAATVFTLHRIDLGPKKDEPEFSYIVTYAGWSDDQLIYENALNYELIQAEQNIHLPIYKIDTIEDLDNFRSAYGSILSLEQGYGSVLSFYEGMSKAQFDREIFYNEHSMLIVYVPANSGSLRFAIDEIKTDDNSIQIAIVGENESEIYTEDMAGWFICVKVDNNKFGNHTSFDAVLSSEK